MDTRSIAESRKINFKPESLAGRTKGAAVNYKPPPDVFSLPYTCSFIVIEYKIFAKVPD
jgi:hypothetical protein